MSRISLGSNDLRADTSPGAYYSNTFFHGKHAFSMNALLYYKECETASYNELSTT